LGEVYITELRKAVRREYFQAVFLHARELLICVF
jgi:predicted alpha/beta-fold hydrolase